MELEVKIDALIPLDDIDVNNSNLEFYLIEKDTFHPLSVTHNDPLYLDSLNQSTPSVISPDTFDSQFVSSHGN